MGKGGGYSAARQQEKGSSLGASCYLPSFGCNGGSVGPQVCVPRGDGSRERIVTELGKERGGRASLKHLGSQTRGRGLEEGGLGVTTTQPVTTGMLAKASQDQDSATIGREENIGCSH